MRASISAGSAASVAGESAGRSHVAWPRLPLLVLGFLALVVGIGAGLARLGVVVPDVAASAAALHGPLMISGFFGVVIALERAVAVRAAWAYLGPLLAGIGVVAALAGATTAPWLFVAGSVVLVAATLDVLRRQSTLFTFTLLAGAIAWTTGNALWAAGTAIHAVVVWWLAFPILTIAGERLELSRFRNPSPLARRIFGAILALIACGLIAAGRTLGVAFFAVGLLALAIWLLKEDIAMRTVRGTGLARFIAVCLIAGYAWLVFGALIILAAGGLTPGTRSYDAAVHALALGFVFSMVLGHAPIIFPAVLRVAVPYHAAFYVPLAILHGSLIVRLAGDATDRVDWARAGGLLNALALAAFILGMIGAVIGGTRQRRA
jgi:hypothetical protein